MTVSDAGRDRWAWTYRLAPLRHYLLAWCLAGFAFSVIGTLFVDPGIMTWVGWLPALTVPPMLIGIIAHGRIAGCSRCVAEIPANGPAEAERRAWPLWFAHQYGWQIGVYLITLVALIIPWLIFGETPLTTAWVSITYLGWAPMFYALGHHDRLRPWCPWCRGGRDDDNETPAPQPVPVGEGER